MPETIRVKFNQAYRFFPDSVRSEKGGVKSGTTPYEAEKGEVMDLDIEFKGIVEKGIATEIEEELEVEKEETVTTTEVEEEESNE